MFLANPQCHRKTFCKKAFSTKQVFHWRGQRGGRRRGPAWMYTFIKLHPPRDHWDVANHGITEQWMLERGREKVPGTVKDAAGP